MWIEELNNGRFKYVERYRDPKTNRYKRVSVTLDSDSKQAWNRATRILNKRIDDKLETKEVTEKRFGEVAKEYFAYITNTLAPSTYHAYKSCYRIHLKHLDDYLLSQITTLDLQKVIDKMQIEKNLSKITANTTINVVRNIFNFADSRYNIKVSVDFPKLQFIDKPKVETKKILTKEEIEHLLTNLKHPVVKALAEFQLLTGARYGETVALTFEDITDETITINKSYSTNRKTMGPTKNKYSNRVISNSERINQIITGRKKANTIAFKDKVKYIFVNDKNKPFPSDTYNIHLKKVIPGLTSHALRHTHISLLAEQGFTVRQIMDRVGHSNPNTTLQIYSHTTDELKKQEGAKIDKLF